MSMTALPEKMIATYVQRRRNELAELIRCVEHSNLEEFRRIGHQWAGNARTYGFPDLEAIGIEMESLEEANYQQLAPVLLNKFKNWLETTTVSENQ